MKCRSQFRFCCWRMQTFSQRPSEPVNENEDERSPRVAPWGLQASQVLRFREKASRSYTARLDGGSSPDRFKVHAVSTVRQVHEPVRKSNPQTVKPNPSTSTGPCAPPDWARNVTVARCRKGCPVDAISVLGVSFTGSETRLDK